MNPEGSAPPPNPVPASGAPAAIAQVPGLPPLEIGIATDPGRDPNKQVNEDAAFARETAHGLLAVVCDGMGGHVGGREASHLAIETIFRVADASPPGTPPPQVLDAALRQANAAVHARGQQSPELNKMGSTCVAILVHAGGTEVAHVGDSRVYLLTHGQIYQVTKDHSLVQRLVDANMLTPEQAANHPNANQITNAFGQRPDVEVEIRPQAFPPTPGDTFLLCSDGLSDELGPQDFLQILAPHPACGVAARQLVDLANARGGHDNITVLLVRFAGGGPLPIPATPTHGHATPTTTLTAAPTTAEMPIVASPVGAPGLASPVGAPGLASPVGAPPVAAAPTSASPIPNAPASVPVSASAAAAAYAPPPAYQPTPIEQPVARRRGAPVAVIVVLLFVAAAIAAAVYFRDRFLTTTTAPPAGSIDDDDLVPPDTGKTEIKAAPTASVDPGPEPRPAGGTASKPKPKTTADPDNPYEDHPHPQRAPSDDLKIPPGFKKVPPK
jgi:protein phosphatase